MTPEGSDCGALPKRIILIRGGRRRRGTRQQKRPKSQAMMPGYEKTKSAPIRVWVYTTVTGVPSGLCVCLCTVCVCVGMLCWPLITPQHNCHSHAFTHSHSSVGNVPVCVCQDECMYQCVCVSICLSLFLSACLSVSLLLCSLIPLQYQRPWFKAAQWLRGESTDREGTLRVYRTANRSLVAITPAQ